jgi:trans-2-enoyl-CoA reductase
MLETLKVPKGEFILQNAAGSTLGRQLIQVAKHQGIRTINIVRRAAQIQELKTLGGDIVLSSEGLSPEQLSEEIIRQAGKRPFAAVDAVAGESTLALSLALRDQGTVLNYGLMSGVNVSHLVTFKQFILYKKFFLVSYKHSAPYQALQLFLEEFIFKVIG